MVDSKSKKQAQENADAEPENVAGNAMEGDHEALVETAIDSTQDADAVDFIAASDPGTEDLINALEGAEAELLKHKDSLLRMQAETENQRKRMFRELENSRRFALERFMLELLPVYDSFERALQNEGDNITVASVKEGSEMTLKMLAKAMENNGLEVIDPLGQPFDPDWHEAVSMQPSDEYAENEVAVVVQKGFKLKDRLIRPAMVVVTK